MLTSQQQRKRKKMSNDAKKNVGERFMFKIWTFLDFLPIHSIYKPHDMSLKVGTWFVQFFF